MNPEESHVEHRAGRHREVKSLFGDSSEAGILKKGLGKEKAVSQENQPARVLALSAVRVSGRLG